MEIEVQTAVDVNICLYGGLKWAGYRKPRSVGVILKDYVGAWQSRARGHLNIKEERGPWWFTWTPIGIT